MEILTARGVVAPLWLRAKSAYGGCAFYLFIRAESGTTARGGNSSDGPGSRISAKREATYCRDRMAPDCPIRHPVLPIVALQRRVRFSARLAWFGRGRCHQRRARRAEEASFSVLVSNLDFRVPRLRPKGRSGSMTGPCSVGKEATREAQNQGRGYRGVAGLARSGPGAAGPLLCPSLPRTWIQVFAQGAWHPVSGRCFPATYGGNPNRQPQRHPPRVLVSPSFE